MLSCRPVQVNLKMSAENQISESVAIALENESGDDTVQNVASGSSVGGKRQRKQQIEVEIDAKKKKKKLDIVDELNSVGTSDFLKLSELEQGVPYSIHCFKFVNTKFGRTLTVEINNGEQSVFLPKRYSNMYKEDDLSRLMSSQIALIYKGGYTHASSSHTDMRVARMTSYCALKSMCVPQLAC
jgi:hypothetical protein